MTTEPSPSPLAADVQSLKSEIKALKEVVAKLSDRLEDIEVELSALRNLI